ncbi:MAG: anhydro-N-acetylmuramic acid kinase, partial [Gammaproteobacteria bacterium]
ARTIAEAIDAADAVAVCGGGAHNDDLMERLARLLQPRRVEATSAWGIDPDWVEAVAFAWMARQRIRGEPSNVPAVTGARAEVSLGGVFLPPTQS